MTNAKARKIREENDGCAAGDWHHWHHAGLRFQHVASSVLPILNRPYNHIIGFLPAAAKPKTDRATERAKKR